MPSYRTVAGGGCYGDVVSDLAGRYCLEMGEVRYAAIASPKFDKPIKLESEEPVTAATSSSDRTVCPSSKPMASVGHHASQE